MLQSVRLQCLFLVMDNIPAGTSLTANRMPSFPSDSHTTFMNNNDEIIRLFLAVDLPCSLKFLLGTLIQNLASKDIDGLRTIPVYSLHVTINFLGNVPDSKIRIVESNLLRSAGQWQPPLIKLGAPGIFPETGIPRTLYLGVEENTHALRAIHKSIAEELEPLGIPKPRRTFYPHITVARLQYGTSRSECLRVIETLMSTKIDCDTEFPITTLNIVRSYLKQKRAQYIRLASIPIGTSLSTGA